MTDRRVGLIAAAGALLYSGAIAIAATSDHASLVLVIPIAAGVSFTGAGIVALARRPDNQTGLLMLEVGFLWALGALTLTSSPLLFTLGAILQQLAFGALAHLLLSYPTGVLAQGYHRRLVATAWVVVAAGPLAISLVSKKPTSCDSCPHSLFLVDDSHTLSVATEVAYTTAALVLAILAMIELARKYHAASAPMRRSLTLVYATSLVALFFLIAANVAGPISMTASTALGAVALTGIALVPMAFLAGLLRSRLARGSVVRLLMDLEEGTPLEAALSRAVGDPSLEIAYWLESRRRWVDAEGRRVADPVGGGSRSVTMVERHGERVAALVHDAQLDDDPDLVHGAAAAAALALQAERLQAELRNQYEFLITLVNTAPSLLVTIDLEGRIVNQNVAVLEASGYDDEEQVRGRYFWDVFIDPEEREDVIARFAAAAPEHPAAEYENPFTNLRGERRVIAWRSAPVKDEGGDVISIVAGGIDITERQRHEEEVRAERDFLITVSRATPSLLAILDPDGRVNEELGVNRAFWNVMGYTDDLATGRYFWELVAPPDEVDSYREAVLTSIAEGTLVERESTWRTRAGESLSVTWTCRPLGDTGSGDGTHPLYLVCGTDVTDHKLRESQLQRERDITETLMQAIPSIVVVVDEEAIIVDSGVDESRAGVNDAFRHALGWPDTALVHRSVLDLIDEDDGYLARMAIASAANGVASPERESRWLRSDGERVVIAWTATPVADVTHRKASLVLLSGIDVTERKRQEEEVRASRARIVQAADDARRKLERNLHDGAQQRLVALSVSLRLAETKLATDPDEAGSILAGAREELAHALEELRELARGIHPAVLTDRGLAAAIDALVTRAPLPVDVELPDERLPPAVEAALYYVVAESLTNVVKYADATSAQVKVELDGDGVATAEVTDDGVGGADPGRGSGLRGLVDRVESLDGRLVVESPSGGGTRVRASIPLASAASHDGAL